MNPVSLRFGAPLQEAGFVASQKSELVLSSWALLGLCSAASAGTMLFAVLGNEVFQPPDFRGARSCAILALYAAQAVVLCRQRLREALGPMGLEYMNSASLTITMLVMVLTVPEYMAKMQGIGLDAFGQACYSDSGIVLLIDGIITAAHVGLPMRWCVLLPLEVAGALLYAVIVFVIGSLEEPRPIYSFILLVALITASAVGKRSAERRERQAFLHVIDERSLRCQAEFALNQPARWSAAEAGAAGTTDFISEANSNVSDRDANCARSVATTTDTGQAFEDARLDTVAKIGRQEQWLVGEEELQVASGDVLGMGGFGIVLGGSYHGTPVAIKVAKRAGSTRLLASVGNELRIMRKLRHPNLVLFHGACMDCDNQDLVLVLERVAGQGMTAFVLAPCEGSEIADTRARCQVLLGICRALRYLHSRQPCVVHGDLKPSNIMVERRSVPCARLLDFGLARCLTRSKSPAGGSYRWVAPEVFGEVWTEQGGSVDVFSFGRIAYFATTLKRPLEHLSDRAMAAIARSSHVPPVSWPAPSPLIDRCRPLVDRATRPDPAKRPLMEEVQWELMSWPESQEAPIGQQDLLRQGSTGHNQFWQLVQRMRESMEKKGLRAELCKGEPARAALPTVPEAAPCAEVGREAAGEGGRPLLTDFQPTPDTAMIIMLKRVLCQWNFIPGGANCCTYHMAVAKLHQIAQLLEKEGCSSGFQPWDEQQCTKCHLMLLPDEIFHNEDGTASWECRHCGNRASSL